MFYKLQKQLNKFLDTLVEKAEIISSDELFGEELQEKLKKHFSTSYFLNVNEYARDNFKGTWSNWGTTERSPLSFDKVELHPRKDDDDIFYLQFDTDHHGGGFKYLHQPIEFAFLDRGFYLGLGMEKKSGVHIYHQNIYMAPKLVHNGTCKHRETANSQ